MPPYKPSDHPQDHGWNNGGKAVDAHEAEYRKYGPPPPNYMVQRKKTAMGKVQNVVVIEYTERASNKRSYDHPLSPRANASGESPIIDEEHTLDREEVRGLFYVPITYKAGPLIWREAINWQTALAAALNNRGIRNKETNQPITSADVQAAYEKLPVATTSAHQNSVLYHPADRKSMVFKHESAVATVARQYNLSTIVFCPFVDHEGTRYKHIYNTENRPPIYARWSTGRQGLFPPLLLGCIPEQLTSQNKEFDVIWFSIEPNKNNIPVWYLELFGSPNILALAEGIGFPIKSFKTKVFLWSLVSLHRRIALGYRIPDDHLACWMWQFGDHLAKECSPWNPPHPSPFNYDGNKLDDYKRKFPNANLSFEQISRFMLNSRMKADNVFIAQYAHVWDKAIDAQIRYQLVNNDNNWNDFVKEMDSLQKLPF